MGNIITAFVEAFQTGATVIVSIIGFLLPGALGFLGLFTIGFLISFISDELEYRANKRHKTGVFHPEFGAKPSSSPRPTVAPPAPPFNVKKKTKRKKK